MPHITTAMERSMRSGAVPYVLRGLLGRDVSQEVDSVKTTFSSWDNCMAKAYCKWPVIAAIIVASLIVLSVLWCIIRCACCARSCCCACFSFLECCDCCGGSCDGKRDRAHRHLDDRDLFPPHQGYQPPAPMMGGALAGPTAYEPPRYAQFEVGKNGLAVDPKANALSEDALPPMPSWETAVSRHVLTEEEKNAVELGELNPVTGQKVPLMTGGAPVGISSPPSPVDGMPASPYGARPGPGAGGNGYAGIPEDPYAPNRNAFNQNARGYGGSLSPAPAVGGRGYGPPQHAMDNYGPTTPQESYPGTNNNGFAGSPVGAYGRPQPGSQYPSDRRQYPPQPVRQYSSDSARPLNPGRQYQPEGGYQPDGNYPPQNFPMSDPPRGPSRGPVRSPPPNNTPGFDFGIGSQQQYQSRPSPPPQQPYGPSHGARYSPPLQQGRPGNGGYHAGSTAPPSYASRSPPPQTSNYQPYVPPSDQETPQALVPGGGREREPQNWDPVQR